MAKTSSAYMGNHGRVGETYERCHLTLPTKEEVGQLTSHLHPCAQSVAQNITFSYALQHAFWSLGPHSRAFERVKRVLSGSSASNREDQVDAKLHEFQIACKEISCDKTGHWNSSPTTIGAPKPRQNCRRPWCVVTVNGNAQGNIQVRELAGLDMVRSRCFLVW